MVDSNLYATMSTRIDGYGTLMDLIWSVSAYSIGALASAWVGMIFLYLIYIAVYNIWLHPLSKYPGPKLASATRLYYCYYLIKGRWPLVARKLHEEYGDVVRVAPNELSYASAEAFGEIYGNRVGKAPLRKDPVFYTNTSIAPGGLFNADRERHGQIRKVLSYSFSGRALKGQESLIRNYADACIERLKEEGKGGMEPINIVKWLNFFTFDVMGELVFGESFDCLTSSGYHPWVALIFDAIKFTPWLKSVKYFPIVAPITGFLLPKDLKQRRKEGRILAEAKASNRKARPIDRLDLASGLLVPENGITDAEYRSTVDLLIIAGSETTATSMSGTIFYLLKNPEKMTKVVAEVRGAFSSIDEINFSTINKLDYLLACLNESLRMYPPTPDVFPRCTGEVHELICGQIVPPRTTLGVSQWSTHRSARNFTSPDDFIPERWLGDVAFKDDKKVALQPFSVGPRNCIGKGLAYTQMRIMMTLLLFSFDLELTEQSRDWQDQKIYVLWEKPDMMIKLHPRMV